MLASSSGAQFNIDEVALIKKLTRRVGAFLCLCYFVAYLDRVNVGFAALTMNGELKFSATVFGTGASIFFIGYLIFEVPSNLVLERVGARRWIARIMVSWGLVSMAMGLVQTEWSFYTLRFLLGVAEAGFFPGVLFYLNQWFPSKYRARITGLLFVAIPLSSVFGAPLSTAILQHASGWYGLPGWKWMFFLEGLPAVLLGLYCFFFLQDRPAGSTWVSAEEATYLEGVLAKERQETEAGHKFTVWQTLRNPIVLLLSAILVSTSLAANGISFWMPQMLRVSLQSNMEVGFVTSGIYVVTAIAMIWWTRRSDSKSERPLHVAIAQALGALCFVVCALTLNTPIVSIAALGLACVSVFCVFPVFWSIPASFLTGAALAAGIAFINSLGQFGGIIAPYLIGLSKDTTGGFRPAIFGAAFALFGASLLVLLLRLLTSGQGKRLIRSERSEAEAT